MPAAKDDIVFDNNLCRSILGHSEQLKNLRQSLAKNAVPHALLFSGPDGIGKRRVAFAFASLLLQGKDTTSEWFNKSTTLLEAGNHPDLHLVSRAEGKKDISVENVRELCNQLHLKPYSSPARVAIVDNADEMSIAASNAMLTTLEEPNAESYLLLVSHAPQRLPATILSRCQAMPFALLGKPHVEKILRGLLVACELDADQTLAPLAALCEGSLEPLHLNQFIDPRTLKVSDPKNLREHFEEITEQSSRLRDLVRAAISSTNSSQRAVIASELAGKDIDSELVWYLLRLELRAKLRTSSQAEMPHWSKMLERALEAERLCNERNTNPQLQFTSLFLEQ